MKWEREEFVSLLSSRGDYFNGSTFFLSTATFFPVALIPNSIHLHSPIHLELESTFDSFDSFDGQLLLPQRLLDAQPHSKTPAAWRRRREDSMEALSSPSAPPSRATLDPYSITVGHLLGRVVALVQRERKSEWFITLLSSHLVHGRQKTSQINARTKWEWIVAGRRKNYVA